MFSTTIWHHEQKSSPNVLPCINIFVIWITILTIRRRWIEKWLPIEYYISMMMSWHGNTFGFQGESIGERFVPQDPTNKTPALEQIMNWCRTGDKPLPEPTRTTRTTLFWGNPHPTHDYPYYQFILDPKSKQDKVKVTIWNLFLVLKHLPKLQIS